MGPRSERRVPAPSARRRAGAVGALAAGALIAMPSDDATACGGFASGPRPPPFLAEELVLIEHDGKTEHFVREVRFAGASDHFGFVVPTPTQPEVAKVEKSPFPALRRAFPFVSPREPARVYYAGTEPWPDQGEGIGLGSIGSLGHGAGYGGGGLGLGGPPGGVKVLSEQRVGSFTAFVLSADDPKSLDAWLAKNQLKMTPAAAPWTARYVARRFFFTAFRYEKPAAGAKELVSETVRLTFETPVAYYPYEEPNDDAKRARRVLSVWTVGPRIGVPLAGHGDAAEITWKRPWREGLRERATGDALAAALGAPRSDAWVQAFVDDKRTRVGWGDVLLVPDEPVELDDAAKESRRALVSLLLPEAP